MKKIAIIPFKSDSKRFPGKNFKFINGKSLLMNTIDKLYEAGVDIIVISTDETEKTYYNLMPTSHKSIFIFDRPKELMGDAATELVVSNVIDGIESRSLCLSADYTIILTQVTSPLWKSHRLKFALGKLDYGETDSVISVSPDYHPNGCFYIFNKSTFLKKNKFYTSNTYLVTLPWKESIDIDYEHELFISNALSRENYV